MYVGEYLIHICITYPYELLSGTQCTAYSAFYWCKRETAQSLLLCSIAKKKSYNLSRRIESSLNQWVARDEREECIVT